MGKDGAQLTPQCEALVMGQYSYVYLTTYNKVKIRDEFENDIVKKNLIIMENSQAKRFFGILYPFYKTARAAITPDA